MMTYVEFRETIKTKIDQQGKNSLKVSDVENVIKAMQEIIMEEVSKEEKFNIPGFLMFNTLNKKAQTGVAFPGTDREIAWSKPAHKTITCRISPSFKTAFETKNNPNLTIEKMETQE